MKGKRNPMLSSCLFRTKERTGIVAQPAIWASGGFIYLFIGFCINKGLSLSNKMATFQATDKGVPST